MGIPINKTLTMNGLSPSYTAVVANGNQPNFEARANYTSNMETLPRTGQRARKIGGSYQADGTIQSAFLTRAGKLRYVFEFDNPSGMLHIFNSEQIKVIGDENDGV